MNVVPYIVTDLLKKEFSTYSTLYLSARYSFLFLGFPRFDNFRI